VSLGGKTRNPKDGFSRAFELAVSGTDFELRFLSGPGLLPRLREIVYGKAAGKWG
jgi:hypothetical protein